MTREQQKRLSAMCGDLQRQVRFDRERGFQNVRDCKDGRQWHKDDFRHALSGKAKGETERYMPDWDDIDKQITIGTSSLRLSDQEATEAIEMAYYLGSKCGVLWSDPKESALREQWEQEAIHGGA